MHCALFAVFAALGLAAVVLSAITLARMPPASAPREQSTDAVAAILAAGDMATTQVFTELSLFAGNLTALDAAQRTPAHAGPLRVARALAIVHIAMADAIGAATRAFQPYTSVLFAEQPTSECAAAAVAAHDTLVQLYPLQRREIDSFIARLLRGIAESPAKRRGIELGEQAAQLILELRADDGSAHAEPPAADFESSQPGKWRRDPVAQHDIALGGLWARRVAPFAITSASQFRLQPPPALTSTEFQLELSEVLARGGDGNTTATVRDEWATMVGLYWAYDGAGNVCAPPRLYLQLAIAIAQQNALPMHQLVPMMATVAIAMTDAGLAGWDSKYFHMRARPVTLIRSDAAGAQKDTHWRPLGAPASNSDAPNFTPPFPAYPSGHAVFGSAMAQVVRTYLGTDDCRVQFTSSEFDGTTRDNAGRVRARITRTFDTLSQIELENANSRIELGIHWRRDCSDGLILGYDVADFVLQRTYAPLRRSA